MIRKEREIKNILNPENSRQLAWPILLIRPKYFKLCDRVHGSRFKALHNNNALPQLYLHKQAVRKARH